MSKLDQNGSDQKWPINSNFPIYVGPRLQKAHDRQPDFPNLLIPFQFYPHESSNYGAYKSTCSSFFHLFPMKMASNGYGVSTPRSAAAPVVPLLPASSALLRAPELPGPSRNMQGTCLRAKSAEKWGIPSTCLFD